MGSQQFNLRWNNHMNNLIQVLTEQYERENLVDVTLSCQGKFLKAHKIVLGSCSPYFQDIFDCHETIVHPVIILNGLKYEEMKAIVDFMYRGEVKVSENELESLLANAETLQVKGLSNVRATRQGQGQSSPPATISNGAHSLSSELSLRSNGSSSLLVSSPSSSSSNHSSQQAFRNERIASQGNLEDAAGTPLHLRRKRAKGCSPQKEAIENSPDQSSHKSESKAGSVVSCSPKEEDNNDDLPMTIKIDPPYIRDIDEEEDGEWNETHNSQKDSIMESCDGSQDIKVPPPLIEPKEKIPRPPNAFMIFANEWRRKLATQFPNESNKEISVRLGIMWKNLSGDSKEEYFAASRQANEDHKKKYPDYYYSPKEARMRKKWKMQQQQELRATGIMSNAGYNPVHLVKVFINDDAEDSTKNKISSRSGTPSASALHA